MFGSAAETAVTARDVVADFVQGSDLLDLRAIHGSGGDPLFVQAVSGAAFSGQAGELRITHNAANTATYVTGDLDGNRTPDFQIQLTGNIALQASDFLL